MTANRLVLVVATVLGALLLTAARLPLEAPEWMRWLRPDWTLAVLLYWALAAPSRLTMVWAWLFGLVVDVLMSDLLGLHAMTYAVAVFAATHLQERLAQYSLLQQTGFAGSIAAAAEFVGALFRAAAAEGHDISPLLLVPALITAAVFAGLVAVVPQTSRFVR